MPAPNRQGPKAQILAESAGVYLQIVLGSPKQPLSLEDHNQQVHPVGQIFKTKRPRVE
jgi:hypothetical protein